MARYEEASQHRSELESVRRENETLRKRVQELELVLKKNKPAESGPTGTESTIGDA